MTNVRLMCFKWYCWRFPLAFKIRQMWMNSFLQNSLTRLNALSRSRKIILGLLLLLGLLYYLGPSLFGFKGRRLTAETRAQACVEDKIASFQKAIDSADALVKTVPSRSTELLYPTYVGNGKIAAAFDSDYGLFIRLHRALSTPMKYYPIIGTKVDRARHAEAHVLHMRSGIAYRLQAYEVSGGCLTIGDMLYAHRSRPSVMVQDIRIHNPTRHDVTVVFDQIGASGWTDSELTSHSALNYISESVRYTMTKGTVKIEDSTKSVAVVVGSISMIDKSASIPAGKTVRFHMLTVVHYTLPGEVSDVNGALPQLADAVTKEMEILLKIDAETLRKEHSQLWTKLWASGFTISESKAAGALNGQKINSTIYYVLSNIPAPLHDPNTPKEEKLQIMKTLHYPDRCYNGHTTLISNTLWIDPVDEDSIARIVTTWMITLEKQGCSVMLRAGIEGVLQAMILSIGALQFGNDHLELGLRPDELHRDFSFRRINYGNNTHLNISIIVGEDNKANIFVSLDRNDKPYYACDAGCIDPPVPLSNEWKQFPVKLTEPITSVLYITADKVHMEELKHAIHVKEIVEAPAHEHHVIALHKHGHHFGGLPTIFWVSIAFLIIVFHLFLFKLIYNEYCQAQERFQRGRYNV